MKIKDIPGLREEVLKMLPITQTEMWKTLGIGHRDGAELIGIMVKENLIKRTKIKNTFLLESANGKKPKISFSILLSASRFSPCYGCEKECMPASCMQLTEWVIGS